MRVGSLNNTINNTYVNGIGSHQSANSPLNDSTHSAGPTNGIIGAGMVKNSNPLSQRDKGVKDQIHKYNKQQASQESLGSHSDINLPYPGPPGSNNHQSSSIPRSSGFRTNRNSHFDGRMYGQQQSSNNGFKNMAASPQNNSSLQNNSSFTIQNSSTLQTQRGSHIGNMMRNKNMSGVGSS